MLMMQRVSTAGTTQPGGQWGTSAGALLAPDHALHSHLHGGQEARGKLPKEPPSLPPSQE